ADLGDVLDTVKAVMRAEVLNKPAPSVALLGLNADQLHEYSHRPRLHLGIGHVTPSVDDGQTVATLNALRTQVREGELAAYAAFASPDGDGVTRPDILEAMNRLSSALYVMMIKAKAGQYGA
ncbi:MAG: hypothetical protein LBK59_09900, partial [Bifidobacteriaceae bacterium]|nr:hypothetical protein [Bifidobacteriaceae bacterium]